MKQVLQGAEIATDFKSGSRKLIPLIHSHGIGMSCEMYQTMAQEMASSGYVVFLIDHKDGTCSFTETENSSLKTFQDISISSKD